MALQTRDQIANALANDSSRIVISKGSVPNQTGGRLTSLWRATGQPAQAAIPTAPALCTKALLGAIAFDNQVAPRKSYIGWMAPNSNTAGINVEVHDRIAHMGGLVLNVTTPQTITGLDLATIGVAADRLGAPNYSDGQWFLEVYADGGATAANATINVTYHDGTSGNLLAQAVGGTIRAGNMFPLTALIPVADQGKFIQRINSVTLSASTTVAGNFGFTYTRQRTTFPIWIANKGELFTYWQLGCPEVFNDSCLFFTIMQGGTSTGTLSGQGKIMHG